MLQKMEGTIAMDVVQKFQELLKKIFQFEASDLDFGIYRVLNYKRDRIEKFIQEDLKDKIESAFAKHKDERMTDLNQRLESAKEKINQNLGPTAFTPTGDLKEEFQDTPLGKDFLSVKTQKEEAEAIDEIKLQVFNDLYNFFSRYYEEGDFVPHYRYSIKGHKYAIPYNGEEVKLYWVNAEQYYTKTGFLFRDYTFSIHSPSLKGWQAKPDGAVKVIFRIVSAREELASNKATKERFFVFDDENPMETSPSPLVGESEGNNQALIIRFQYRELTEKEVKDYEVVGGSNVARQEKINQRSYKKALKMINDAILKEALSREYRSEKPLLLYHISRFTAKNTRDYFIHKNLKKFLSEQLDYFIKAEVLDIETLAGEKFLDKHITRARVVREIGEDLIDFLSQIEDFQKMLWEKKKFVLKTEYVITIDRVPEEFHQEIWNNEEQKKEWKESGFDIPSSVSALQKQESKLPLDTKYFSQEFKEKLLEKLTEIPSPSTGEGKGKGANLDDLLDGLLIKSENWQALNLLLDKYKEKVQTIYIDPPFNKEQDADYLYNVKYKDSTWATILENRLQLAKEWLNERGSIFVRCDNNGNWIVRPLMNGIFGEENFRNEIGVRRFRKNVMEKEIKKLPEGIDTIYVYSSTDHFKYIYPYKRKSKQRKGFWRHMGDSSGQGTSKIFFGKELSPPAGKHWKYSQENIDQRINNGTLILVCANCGYQHYKANGVWKGCPVCKDDKPIPKYWVEEQEDEVLDSNWIDLYGYSTGWNFQTENSEILLKRVIESTSNEGNLVMDFFLGSGTTTAVAHKLGRKWIGVEMGEHFYTVILPRMKKVLAYDKSGISKEEDVKEKYNKNTAGGFFKYQVLEQYEDSLDNIELKENKQAQLKFGDNYLLKYFLDYETRGNTNLLNIEQLKNPFSYQLKVNLEEVGEPQEIVVNLPETFNYLLELKVKKIKTREIASPSTLNDQRKYLFTLGEKEGKDIAIVWRKYEDSWSEKDFKRDREFISKELEPWAPHIVYINGQSILTPKLGKHTAEIRYIEPEFKRLME